MKASIISLNDDFDGYCLATTLKSKSILYLSPRKKQATNFYLAICIREKIVVSEWISLSLTKMK